MRSRSLLGLSVGLLAAAALAEPPPVVQRRIRITHEPLPQEPRLRPSPTPKKGKPTKAEKKAAKRARAHGVPGAVKEGDDA